jgi:hypothetical protein
MKRLAKEKTFVSIGLLLGVALSVASTTAVGQDLEANFRNMRLGLTREAVIGMLGPPNAEISSTTFNIRYERLTWVGRQRRFVASFIQDRMWHWQACSASVADC